MAIISFLVFKICFHIFNLGHPRVPGFQANHIVKGKLESFLFWALYCRFVDCCELTSPPLFPRPRSYWADPQACSIVFAPEKITQDTAHPYQLGEDGGADNLVKCGPLAIALQDRHQLELFCTQPLVLDFMFRKFTCGFPSLDAADAKMQEAQEVQRALQATLSVQDGPDRASSDAAGDVQAVLAGPHPTFGSLTFLPGAQFIITQLVTRPGFCYSVPAVRMGMYLIVYLTMIALFGSQVLMYHGTVGAGEVIFFIYVVVSG